MTVMRPCLACGQENLALAERCSRCDAELAAWAEAPPFGAARKGSAATRGRPALVGLLLLVIACAAGWSVVRYVSASTRADVGPTWFEPKTMAAWATDDLRAKGVPPGGVQAVLEKRTTQTRRVLVSTHAPEQDLTAVLRAAASFLVEARRRGAATLTHVAVVRHGDDIVEIPLGEAARLADPSNDVAEWLGRAIPATAPAEAEAPVPASPRPRRQESRADLPPAGPVPAPAAIAAPPPPGPPLASPAIAQALPPARAAAPPPGPSAPAPPGEPSKVRVLKGPGPAIPARVKSGESSIVLLRVQVHPGARRAMKLASLTVRSRGTLGEVEDIAFVDLVRDADRDGRKGAGDQAIGGRQSFTDDDGTATFGKLDLPFGADGAPLYLLVTVDVADQTTGGTEMLTIPDAGAVVVADAATGGLLAVKGAPLNGPIVTVEGTIQADPEQERLDSLAEQGPEATDQNLERLKVEAASAAAAAADGQMQPPGGASGASGASGPAGVDLVQPVRRSPRFPKR